MSEMKDCPKCGLGEGCMCAYTHAGSAREDGALPAGIAGSEAEKDTREYVVRREDRGPGFNITPNPTSPLLVLVPKAALSAVEAKLAEVGPLLEQEVERAEQAETALAALTLATKATLEIAGMSWEPDCSAYSALAKLGNLIELMRRTSR